ncbi:MAG TPA: glutathione S-transferase [Geminicoccaceae bacterium]|nr:glutathione S-transferase [Geminicoccaceae bacterium]
MMLHSNPASPFGRKVKVLARETGLFERLEVHDVQTTAVGPDPTLLADNPLGKIPCLVLDDGTSLFDSRVICEYLDTLHAGPRRMFPAGGEPRWAALRLQALADGILDAALLARYETFLRPEPRRWPAWIDGQLDKVTRGLDRLELEADRLTDAADIGAIAVGCALGYLDFRFPDLGWRERRPRLAGWFEGFAARRSMQETRPPD